MTKKSRLELAVGIFIIIGLGVLVSFVFFISDFQLIKAGYKFDVVFGFANGIKIGAPARLAGVDVGEVKDIVIFQDSVTGKPKARIRVWVQKDTRVPADSQIWINTLGLLGEKYLEMMPGKNYELTVKENDTLQGKDPIPMEEITEETRKLVLKIEETVDNLNEVLGQVKAGQGNVGKLVYDEIVYKNIMELTEDLKQHPWKLFWRTKEKPEKK
ncbi:MAG: hypothetical protein A2Y00_07975 [Omnitrophica WOR_2 bacterium GWF2_43_52]|nr:MAG: hypothetical protein A2062_06750 [Omnitrophica WOR_2 bacterium GWA2_44_7]OGX14553.1 MAG: hypothetical protein A2Y01_04505 [Omnitrophica WOR_2 bacterium GWC2_44_8]OGX21375.1 MAG: hypothetical protein A2Y00_07975 [Omnitrophica WOR_2 bacterium GWF2_43_52]OGX54817.1 MAG: hypothetical protein A2460_05875 [Omnitrophica WOR_2 bacterium RIFOXYC2_FULL_43_9]HAH22000.1 hypothetical protein [Candidatus Omnitrophota bacterium]